MALGILPDHVEVILRICFSLILTHIITLGLFPGAVPPWQTVIIILASVALAFAVVHRILLFLIGAAIFQGMVMGVFMALVSSTFLLAVTAAGGVQMYIFCNFFGRTDILRPAIYQRGN